MPEVASRKPLEKGDAPHLVADAVYVAFIKDVKRRIQSAQIKAAVKVNQELLYLYWDLGECIISEQEKSNWGAGFLEQMSKDLRALFPGIKGFSRRNLYDMRRWVRFWDSMCQQSDFKLELSFVRQLVAQIPWGHNLLVINKIKDGGEALFYVQKTIENNWSRTVLTHQIESELYHRSEQALSNFETTLPTLQSDLAGQMLKDPYCFDFLMLREKHDEKELEDALTNHLTRFLLELGAGFSFLGRQYRIEVAEDEYFIDMLFYHVQLHCYVVIELKTVKFKPEFAGKLNFYISAVDDLLKKEKDDSTIGILICKSKNNTVVEYALKDLNKPIGVSEYTITKNLPEELKSSLPSIEELEAELERTI